MKVLVAISSCQRYEDSGLNNPIRETWLPALSSIGWDYKFFHGEGSTPKDDVVVLPVEDALFGLTEKAKAKLKWAYSNYDYVFSCFPDTYAVPERLLTCGFEYSDYLGNVYRFPKSSAFCQGGPGYFLSRSACLRVFSCSKSYLNDDCFIGDVLDSEQVKRIDHRGFTAFGPGPLKSNQNITNHLSTQPGGFTAEGMKAEHRRWLESCAL
jgi:hypothetical protein